MLPALPLELAAVLLGLVLGSFLNVCIVRLPRGESAVSPGSRCPRCGHPIRPWDNIPILSWLMLRGRCRHCRARISPVYPAVELASALWLLVATLVTRRALLAAPDHTTDLVLDGIATALLGLLLIALAVIDWQTQTLPDALTLPGAAAGFLLACTHAFLLPTGADDIHLHPRTNLRLQSPGSFAARGDVFLTGPEAVVLGRLAAILAAAGLLLLIRALYLALRRREGLGLGDAKLLGMIAAFLGFGDAMLAFFLGMIACTAYALVLLARRRATAQTRLPLGSFLAAGGLLTALLGEAVLTWYKGLL